TGRTSVGELLITRRISLVAVCCSRASLRARLRPSTSSFRSESAGRARLRGVAQFKQKFASRGFSCWHRGHCILRPPSGSEPGPVGQVARAYSGGTEGSRTAWTRSSRRVTEVTEL